MKQLRLVGLIAVGAGVLSGACTQGGQERAATRGAVMKTAAEAGPAESQSDALLEARSRGDPEAPITIFEASDFQCPYCRDFWSETLPIIERDYIQTGKARLIFLNFPITQIHPNAAAAHELAMCAAMQDLFWPVHDLLYRYQGQWEGLGEPSSYFMTLADSAGVDREELEGCLSAGAVRQLILEEVQAAWQAGIRSTPSFVIEGGLLTGAQPIGVWRTILDSLFAAKTNQ